MTGTRRKRTRRQLGLPLVTASKRRVRAVRLKRLNPTMTNNTIVTLILRHQTKSKNPMPTKGRMIPSRRYGID